MGGGICPPRELIAQEPDRSRVKNASSIMVNHSYNIPQHFSGFFEVVLKNSDFYCFMHCVI